MDIALIGGNSVLKRDGDVAQIREAGRRRRMFRYAIVLVLAADYVLARWLGGDAVHWGWPDIQIPQAVQDQIPALILITVLATVLLAPMLLMGRSPHTVYRPSEIPVTLDDVVGLGMVARRGRQDAQPVPRLQDLPRADGRQPAQGDPVRRSAGNRQDLHGQGDGAGGRRPVPLRRRQLVPVDVLRPDQPQDPPLLQGAAQGRAREGGAIGFIEEIDAIGVRSQRHAATRQARHDEIAVAARAGSAKASAGVVNELLIQLQSFDEPTRREKLTRLVHLQGQPVAARRGSRSGSARRCPRTSS